jgi:hypothetical protein
MHIILTAVTGHEKQGLFLMAVKCNVPYFETTTMEVMISFRFAQWVTSVRDLQQRQNIL